MSNLTQNQVLIAVIIAVLLIVGVLILLVGDGSEAPNVEEEDASGETYRPADDTSIVVIEMGVAL